MSDRKTTTKNAADEAATNQAAGPVPVETPAPVPMPGQVMRIARQRTVDRMNGGQDSRDSGLD